MSRIGFIGTGDIAIPMVRFLARKGHEIWVSKRSEKHSVALASEFANVTRADNQTVVDNADIVFLCLRPQVWEDPVKSLNFRADQRIVSVMSGPSIAELETACVPVRDISVMIPLAALEHGGCPLPVFPANSTTFDLFAPENPVLPQAAEADIARHFVASALLSAVFGLMHDGAEWLGEKTGNPDAAETYVTALITSMLRDVPHKAGALNAERAALATPGTLNLAMVEGLRAGGTTQALQDTMDAILARLDG